MRARADDVSQFGCAKCWSADAQTAWNLTWGLRRDIEVLDGAHLHQNIVVCDACSQKFLKTFYEEIDWEDGDDPQYLTVFPITTAEEDALLFRGDGSLEFTDVGKDRWVVRKDCPKGDPDGVIRWGYGYRLKPDDS